MTAANVQDARASFAGRGTQISIAAYGTYGAADGSGPRGLFGAFPANLTSLETGSLATGDPPCNCRAVFNGDSRYAYVGGTSMAAPQVTAVAAMVRHLNPDLTRRRHHHAHQAHRSPSGRHAAGTRELGWGILDAGAAIAAARAEDRSPPVSRLKTSHRLQAGKVTLRLTGSDPAPRRRRRIGDRALRDLALRERRTAAQAAQRRRRDTVHVAAPAAHALRLLLDRRRPGRATASARRAAPTRASG